MQLSPRVSACHRCHPAPVWGHPRDIWGHFGGTAALDGDGAVAEVSPADEGVDEDGVALARGVLGGAEHGLQPLALRPTHHEAFGPQRLGRHVVVWREGTAGVALSPPGEQRLVGGVQGHRVCDLGRAGATRHGLILLKVPPDMA